MAKKEETYNEAIEKLRKIVAEIENGDLDVDILSEKVKEATRLIKLCKEKLDTLTVDKLEGILAFANKAASITTSRHGAIPAMPTLAEVEG